MTGLASRGQLRASLFRWALFTVPLVLLLGFLSGRVGSNADSPWFQSLVKPDIFPPAMWFGIVWSILYVLMGVALAIVCAAWGARGRTAAIVAFALQLIVNLAWSPVFFAMHRIREALIVIGVLDVLVIVTIVLGVAGALVAGFLGRALGWYQDGEPAGLLASIVGAIILLAGYRLVAGRSAADA